MRGVTRAACWLVVGWSVFIVASAQDVIFHLRNGDRITGRVLSEASNQIILSTPFAERLTIPASLVERREPAPNVSTNAPVTPAPTPPAKPATGVVGELVLTNKPSMAQTAGGAAKPPEAKPKPPEVSAFDKFLSEWRGEAQLGANLGFSTKERKTFTGRMKLTHNHTFPNQRPMRNILDYDVAYGVTDSELSDNRMDGTWKTEYDVSKRVLVYNVVGAGYDEIRGIDFQYDVGPGLGYKWLLLTNFVFKTELGGNYQEEFFIHDKKNQRYSLRLAEDSWWQVTPKIRWDQKVEFFPEVQDFGNYRIRLESNLSYLLKQNLTLTLNVVDLYDTAVPSGITKNDLQIRSLLGIKF